MIIDNVEAKMWLAIKGRLDEWTDTTVYYPNEVYEPDALKPHLIVSDIPTEGDTRAIRFECGEVISGILNVSVLVPISWTWAQHKSMCGAVCGLINNSGPLTYADVTVHFNRRARLVTSPELNLSWNRVEVQAPYRAWG